MRSGDVNEYARKYIWRSTKNDVWYTHFVKATLRKNSPEVNFNL